MVETYEEFLSSIRFVEDLNEKSSIETVDEDPAVNAETVGVQRTILSDTENLAAPQEGAEDLG